MGATHPQACATAFVLGAVASHLGRRDEGLKLIERAVAAGVVTPEDLASPICDSLRDAPGFLALSQRVRESGRER